MKNRYLALILSLVLILGLVPLSAFAEDNDINSKTQTSESDVSETEAADLQIYKQLLSTIALNNIYKNGQGSEKEAGKNSETAHVKETKTHEPENPYKGKSVAFYGDSLTEKGFASKKGYHEWIRELAELGAYENYAVHGYSLKDIYHELKDNKTSADIIFVMGGTNDQTWSIPYGSYSDKTEDTTCGSLYLICEYLKKEYADRKIIFITPPYQTRYPHKQGITYEQIGDAIKHYCKMYGFQVYDNGTLSGIDDSTLDKMTFDQCHWTDQTHEKIGRAIAAWLMTIE